MRSIGNFLIVLGVAAFFAATAWWLLFFYEVLGDDFQVARECFYWTTHLCSLKTPASLFSEVPEYDPRLLWLAAGMFGAGLLIRVSAARR